jgi:hypothetical protein
MKVKRISSIFEEVSKIKSKNDRVDFIRKNQNQLMKALVQCAYHPNVEWLLPEGSPVYIKNKDSYESDIVMYQELNKLYLFLKGGNVNVTQEKRAKLFVQLLEKLHPEDAELLIAVKDRKINYPFMTSKLFQEAVPDWFL